MTPEKIYSQYERGILTRHEALWELGGVAAEQDPVTLASLIPDEFLAELRQRTECIPRPDELRVFSSVCNAGPYDPVKAAAGERAVIERYVAGLRTWKAYFESVGREIAARTEVDP